MKNSTIQNLSELNEKQLDNYTKVANNQMDYISTIEYIKQECERDNYLLTGQLFKLNESKNKKFNQHLKEYEETVNLIKSILRRYEQKKPDNQYSRKIIDQIPNCGEDT
jgi:hypothetical protein